jgi:FkbM family methyltransferase
MNMRENRNTHQFATDYIDAQILEMSLLKEKVEQDFSHGIAIYGAGFVGSWAAQYLKSIGAKIDIFIDKDPNKAGVSINGIPVVSPEDPLVEGASTIIIAARHAVREVTEAMARLNAKLMSFDGYYVVKNYERLSRVRSQYLCDDRSVETFNAVLLAMLTGSVESCRAVMEKDMYFALPEFSGTFNDIYVDAGAFVGDSVERFIWENLGTFKHIYAFEPGHRQFKALQTRVARLFEEWALDDDCVSLVKAGLSDEEGKMAFSFLQDSPLRHGLIAPGSEYPDNDGNASDVHCLDSFLDGKEITFLKADVEGMEMELLRGAERTIRRFKPKLAICAYHYPSHLFEIAEYIRSLAPEYVFYLRQHAPIMGDYVLYACIPGR